MVEAPIGDVPVAGVVEPPGVVLIAAALYFGYFRMQGATSGRSSGVAAIDASRSVACRTQRIKLM
jgi:hypothetical protein